MKAKMKFVVEIEYEQDPKYYPAGSTQAEMIAIDLEGANGDPFLMIDNDAAKWEITCEPIAE